MTSVIGVLYRSQSKIGPVISILSGPKVDQARNDLFRKWLATDCTHLLMLDSDMVFPEDTLERLLAHNKAIVGGLCFQGGIGMPVKPAVRHINEEGGFDIYWDLPENQLVQVAATGGACMLIHREVAEFILGARGEDHPLPWFAHGIHKGVEIGEDIAFCITAQKCGYDIFVDTSLQIGHVKSEIIDLAAYHRSLSNESHPHYTGNREVNDDR